MNGLERRIKLDKSISDIDFYIKDKIEGIVDNLSNIIKENKKTLIFTWMDLKSDSTEVNDDSNFIQSNMSSEIGGIKLVSESKSTLINPNQSFYKYIQHRLEDRGFKVGEDFSIEYYGSGKDKAINDYRDYDAVVMCGNYRVPNSVISDFNLMFHTNITGTEYYANRAIQAICRTRIRKHNGDPIFIYYTSDIDKKVIDRLLSYLDNGLVEDIYSGNYMKVAPKFKIKTKWKPIIDLFCKLDYEFERCIYSGFPYNLDFTLDEIYKLIPMSRKERCKYNSLVSYLKTLGINLNIHLK
jgi:hypothetical protein